MELKILEHCDFGQIRTTTDERGNVLFSGIDVARALGYSRPKDAIRSHAKGAVKYRSLTNGGMQELIFIYEPDLYRLIIKSKLPSALAFEKWLFTDVLPSIRQYKMYVNDELLANPDACNDTLNQLRKNQMLVNENERLLETIVAMQPHIDYLETIIQSNCTMTITQIGADYGLSAIRLNRILHKAKVHRRVGGQWVLYGKYMNRGFTSSETVLIPDIGYVVQTKWTQKGRHMIHELLEQLGIMPNDPIPPLHTGR